MMEPAQAVKLSHAIQMATEAHHGQYRKYTGEPYVIHPLRVMLSLADKSITVQIAAVLHDTVEDTALTLTGIRREFGAEVARLVDALSRRDGETYAEFITRIRLAGLDAIEIKLGDVEDNMRNGSPGRSDRYSKAYDRLMAAKREIEADD